MDFDGNRSTPTNDPADKKTRRPTKQRNNYTILLLRESTKMSQSTDPGHFFQTDASESKRARKAAKSGNKNGNPIALTSKILHATPDPFSSTSIYIAESAGLVRKVNVEVGTDSNLHLPSTL